MALANMKMVQTGVYLNIDLLVSESFHAAVLTWRNHYPWHHLHLSLTSSFGNSDIYWWDFGWDLSKTLHLVPKAHVLLHIIFRSYFFSNFGKKN